MKSPAAESLPWSGSLPTFPKNHTTQQKDFPTKKTSKMYGYSYTVRVSEASLSGKERMKEKNIYWTEHFLAVFLSRRKATEPDADKKLHPIRYAVCFCFH